MKLKAYTKAFALALFATLFTMCDVHEFPEERRERVPFLLHLDFNTEMPLYKEIAYSRSEDNSKVAVPDHDLRYTVKVYRVEEGRANSRVADSTFVFTKANIKELNYTVPIELYEGTYTFRVWADYVSAGSDADKYYDTQDFAEIILSDRESHSGSNDYREAFRGYATATVTYPTAPIDNLEDNQVTVEMKRPMGKFKFISTDVDIFFSRVIEILRKRGVLAEEDADSDSKSAYDKLLQSINLKDFKVVFRYNAFMPCAFNMFTDKPADSWTGMSFTSSMYTENDNEMSLGYDYIFVNGSETTLSISVDIYDDEGELMSSSYPVDVPIVRNKLTVVKGSFLTSKASGGVSINPGFDGEDYNIEIK